MMGWEEPQYGPVVPEQEPLACLLHVLLAAGRQDLPNLGLHLAEAHLQGVGHKHTQQRVYRHNN